MIARALAATLGVALGASNADRLDAQGQPASWSNIVASLRIGANDGDQIIYVTNHSDQTVIVNGVTLADCENVRGPCATRRLNVRVHPGQEVQVHRVRQRFPDQRFHFRYSFSWTLEKPEPQIAGQVVALPIAEAGQVENRQVRALIADAVKADSSASRVADTVEVTPAYLSLRAGEQLDLAKALVIAARSAEGDLIAGLRLRISIEVGREFAKVDRGALLGIKPGTAVLLISPPQPEDAMGEPKGAARVMVRVLP